MTDAIVVMSGGQDSVTCLFWALKQWKDVEAVTFDFSQRHKVEVSQAETICKEVEVPWTLIKLSGFEAIKQSSALLSDKEIKVDTDTGLPTTFVPGRNMVFLTYAAALAYTKGCTNLVTGVTSADFWTYKNITWDWLAGFFEAEGYVSNTYYLNSKNEKVWIPTAGVCQNNYAIINKIKMFVDAELGITSHITSSRTTNGISYALELKYIKNWVPFFNKLSLHMNDKHKVDQVNTVAHRFNLQGYDISENKINWDWFTGFWEGDGGIQNMKYLTSAGTECYIPVYWIYQKENWVLERIKEFVGKGTVSHGGYQCSDGKSVNLIYDNIRPNLRIKNSRIKLSKVYTELQQSKDYLTAAYPDTTPEAMYWIQKALRSAMRFKFNIHAPVQYLSKAESVKLAKEVGALPYLKFSHTCYEGKRPACGVCPACKLRIAGFKEAKIKDPIEYAIDIDWSECE